MNSTTFKIAVVTDDNKTVSMHFGPSRMYEVFTIENNSIAKREIIEKYNAHAPGQQLHQHNGEHTHSHGAEAESKHNSMIENIKDCEYLISRGMGFGIFQHLEIAGIKPIITDIGLIEESIKAVIDGTIVNHTEKLH
jgi:predicted Fe-Mo cluster-binding NifX family protein